MSANNYFRVAREVFPFVDTSPTSTRAALESAGRYARDFASRRPGWPIPRIVVYRVPEVPGVWSRFGVVGEERHAFSTVDRAELDETLKLSLVRA